MGSRFVGVFPLNKLPPLSTLVSGNALILNTHTANLPGQHWIAVYVKPRELQVFDPLGATSYPHSLVAYLHMDPKRRVVYNRAIVQSPLAKDCGQHCLHWLKSKCVHVCVCG